LSNQYCERKMRFLGASFFLLRAMVAFLAVAPPAPC
jgi:hypothetical protein